jgi:tetratricopeptide (TPR) repeat protein
MFYRYKRVFFLTLILFFVFTNLLPIQFLLQKGSLFKGDRLVDIELQTINSLQVIFKITPEGWTFPKDISELVKTNLYIRQNDKKIIITEVKNYTDYLLISFSQNSLNIHNNFDFSNTENTLPYEIDESKWPDHDEFKSLYNEAIQHAIKLDHLAAFSTLTPFLVDENNINEFSFTSNARTKAEESITNYFSSKEMLLNTHRIKHSKSLEQTAIVEIDSLILQMERANELFSTYYAYSPETSHKTDNEKIISDYQDYFVNLKIRYFDEIQALFINSDYNNFEFKLMLDTLVRTLCHKDSLCLISEYNIANMDYLNFNQKRKNKLTDLDWLNNFERLIIAVNLNLENHNYFLKPDCLESLRNKDIDAPQPYYQILESLQFAHLENWTDFSLNINSAIEKCSDQEMLHLLERLKIAYIAKVVINLNQNVIDEINSGIRDFQQNDFESAKNSFQKAKNWQSNFAFPDYMLGEVCVKTGEFTKAEIYYDNAIQKQPQYLEPIYAKLYLLIKNEKHKDALDLLNLKITTNSWYKYFLLGRLSLLLQDNKKAKEYFEMALNINSANFDLLIELGDTYKNLNDKSNAEKFYRQAGFLDPENDIFTARLQALNSD